MIDTKRQDRGYSPYSVTEYTITACRLLIRNNAANRHPRHDPFDEYGAVAETGDRRRDGGFAIKSSQAFSFQSFQAPMFGSSSWVSGGPEPFVAILPWFDSRVGRDGSRKQALADRRVELEHGPAMADQAVVVLGEEPNKGT